MKITVKQLKTLIREVALSPSLKGSAYPEQATDSKNFSKALEDLESAFGQALIKSLVVPAMEQHYDPQTRQFDDAVYEQLKATSETASQRFVSAVKSAAEQAWKNARGEK